MLDWQGKTWIKTISAVLIIAFLTYDIAWATDFSSTSQRKDYASRSLFKNKKVNYNSIKTQIVIHNTLRLLMGFASEPFRKRYNDSMLAAGESGKPVEPLALRFTAALEDLAGTQADTRTSVARVSPISLDWTAFRRGEGTPLKVIAGAFIDGEQNALLSDLNAIKGRHIIIKNANISNPRDFILLELIIGTLKDHGAKVTVSGMKLAYHDTSEERPHAVILQGIIDRLSETAQDFRSAPKTQRAASKPDQVLYIGAQKQGLAQALAEKFNVSYAEVSATPTNDEWPVVALPAFPKYVKRVMLVVDSATDEDLLKIELAVGLLKANGVKEVSIVEPYIRYSRQHHFEVNKTGQVGSNSFKTFLDILDGFSEKDFKISALYGANIHAVKYDDKTGKPMMVAEGYAGDVDIIDIDVLPEIARYFVQKFSLGSRKLFVMATDKGSNFYAENVVKFLKILGLDAEFVYAKKTRIGETSVDFENQIFRKLSGGEAEVNLDELEGADVLIVDDELRTGGTLRKLGALLTEDLKAGRVFVGFTHGIFSLGPEKSKRMFRLLLEQGRIAASNSIVSVTENDSVLPEKINIDSYIAEKIYSHFLTSRTVRVGI